MSHQRVKLSRGFTIIEVMIVLAIAGLIMLLVFLAIPPLQRSGRNQQRKTDVSSIAASIANYITNNGGSVPASVSATGNDLLICGATCTGNTETAKLGYYLPANVQLVTNVASLSSSQQPTKDTVVIDVGYSCNSTGTGIGASSSRTASILFAVETSATNVAQQCYEQ